jgi:amidase
MDAESLSFLSLTELSKLLRDKKLSSVEVTQCVLDRIRVANPYLHAYLTVTKDSALVSAARADAEIGAGRWRGSLHGVPVAVKDLLQTKGVATTCASRVLRDWRPESNATVVDRLESAGAVILGKLNLTEFAVAWYHPELPVPLNPWDPALWPGASSSGSGIATAAGLCFASIGTDTGGSIRFPSAACGIVGLKPTWGRVSRHGVFPLGESLDHIGPMTRSVADAAAVLSAIAGPDPADETSLATPPDDYIAAVGGGAKEIRIGVDDRFIADGSSPEVAASIAEAIRVFARLGGRIVKIRVPDTQACVGAWNTICTAETAAAHKATYPSRAADYGPGFRSFLELGAAVRGQEYATAHMTRERFSNQFQRLFDQIDVLVCPSMSVASLPANAMPADASGLAGPNPLVLFTAPFNLSRNPTLSLPCGQSISGPPPSLQLVGRHLGEAVVLQAGAAFEEATSWHLQRPSLRGIPH